MEQTDYKELYEQAKERARHKLTYAQVEEIFPEPESEDEKVIHCLEYTVRHFYEDEDTIKWCCDWLKFLKDRVQPQPKQEWSEEDEYQINTILHGLDLKRELYKKEGNKVEEERYNTQYNWLKSLRPQNGCTYNPYKAVVESIAEMCKHYDKATDLQDFYDNVKVKCKDAKEYDFLYPQSQWKPSGEQIKALEKTLKYFQMLNAYGETIDGLKELLEQLNKQKGE